MLYQNICYFIILKKFFVMSAFWCHSTSKISFHNSMKYLQQKKKHIILHQSYFILLKAKEKNHKVPKNLLLVDF